MSNCPYPETLKDECSGAVVPDDKYKAWHEGYEAHKLEVLKLVSDTNRVMKKNLEYTIALARAIADVQALRVELTTQKNKIAERL